MFPAQRRQLHLRSQACDRLQPADDFVATQTALSDLWVRSQRFPHQAYKIAPSRRRLAGRSANDAIVNAANTTSTITCHNALWVKSTVRAGPVMLKKIAAYAHSLSLGKRGTNMAMAPSTFQNPIIVAKYGGYPS